MIDTRDLTIPLTCFTDSSASSLVGRLNWSRLANQGPTYWSEAVLRGVSALENPITHSLRNSRVRWEAELAKARDKSWTQERELLGMVKPAEWSTCEWAEHPNAYQNFLPDTLSTREARLYLKNWESSFTKTYAPIRRVSLLEVKFRRATFRRVAGTSVGLRMRELRGVSSLSRDRADRIIWTISLRSGAEMSYRENKMLTQHSLRERRVSVSFCECLIINWSEGMPPPVIMSSMAFNLTTSMI